MRPFRSFFLMSLVFFLFLFFARFIILAFIAAAILTFIGFVVRKIRMISHYPYWDDRSYDYSYQHRRYTLPSYEKKEEPLFFERERETEFDWWKEYRTIKVQ